jgi:hypothetical protein
MIICLVGIYPRRYKTYCHITGFLSSFVLHLNRNLEARLKQEAEAQWNAAFPGICFQDFMQVDGALENIQHHRPLVQLQQLRLDPSRE